MVPTLLETGKGRARAGPHFRGGGHGHHRSWERKKFSVVYDYTFLDLEGLSEKRSKSERRVPCIITRH